MIHFLNFDVVNSKLSAIMRYPHPFIAIPQPKKVLTIHLGLFGRQISNKTFSYIIKQKGPLNNEYAAIPNFVFFYLILLH